MSTYKNKNKNNEKGAAFVTVLLILIVFSVFTVTLLNVSLTEGKHAIKSERLTQALYYSKTSALATANYLITNRNNPTIQGLLASGVDKEMYNGPFANGTSVVRVLGENEKTLTIQSTWTDANNANYTKTVKLQLKRGIPPVTVGKYGIQAKTTIEADGGPTIQSNLAAYDDIDIGSIDISPFKTLEGAQLGEQSDYLLTFPDNPGWPSYEGFEPYTINEDINNSIIIDSKDAVDGYVLIDGNVQISGAKSYLKFKADREMYIKVEGDFSLKGAGGQGASMILEGTGPIHILVDGNLELGANSENELGESLTPENFVFYVIPRGESPERTVTLTGNTEISCMIVAPDLHMKTNGTPSFSGISWVDSFSGSGSFTYKQNPIPEDFYDTGLFNWPLQVIAYSY